LASHLELPQRRRPQQARGERRVTALLRAAALTFAEDGFEAATMSQIADRAGSSIGSLYQFFPNKEALALALQEQYCDDAESLWGSVEDRAGSLTLKQICDRLIEENREFLDAHPALPCLLEAHFGKRHLLVRQKLRERMTRILVATSPGLAKSKAIRLAAVTVALMKPLNELYAEVKRSERQQVVEEMKFAVQGYLEIRLAPAPNSRS
jgi:AcrR family transcriptional regulator